MSIGDLAAPRRRPRALTATKHSKRDSNTASPNNKVVPVSRSAEARHVSSRPSSSKGHHGTQSRAPDGTMEISMDIPSLAGGRIGCGSDVRDAAQAAVNDDVESLRSSRSLSFSPRVSRADFHLNRGVTRTDLEKLFTTVDAEDKQKRIVLALDGLQDSCRGTALAFIVNETLGTASVAVARAAVRRETLAGHERAGESTDVRERFDEEHGKPWKSSGLASGSSIPASTSSSSAAAANSAGLIRPSSVLKNSQEHMLGRLASNLQPTGSRPKSPRRFTVQLLPFIPEHRVPGRPLHMKESIEGSQSTEKISNRYEVGGEPKAEENNQGKERAAARAVDSLAALCCEGYVANVPRALLGEATSTGVDPFHPPCSVADGALASFWMSTGLFPQTLTIRLERPVMVHEVIVGCGGIRAASLRLDTNTMGSGHAMVVKGDIVNGDEGNIGGRGTGGNVPDHVHRERRSELAEEKRRPSLGDDGGSNSAPQGVHSGKSEGVKGAVVSGDGGPYERLVFRVPYGRRSGQADRLSLVVTSGRAQFCLVWSIAIRGQFSTGQEDGDPRDNSGEVKEETR